jgi:hypothetical protein
MKRNYWICDPEHFGGWEIEFPKFESLDQIIRLKDYMAKVLTIGKEERILNIGSSHSLQMLDVPLLPYIEQVEWLVEHRQVLQFFAYLHVSDAEISGFVSYFGKQGEIVEAEIRDMWELSRQLNPPKYEPVEAPRTPPVGIRGRGHIKTDRSESLERSIQASIYLRTDIWFPKLAHWRNYTVLRFDNRELAYRHTPRLNKFVIRLRELTLQWGGTWTTIAPNYVQKENYKSQLTEMGIRIP